MTDIVLGLTLGTTIGIFIIVAFIFCLVKKEKNARLLWFALLVGAMVAEFGVVKWTVKTAVSEVVETAEVVSEAASKTSKRLVEIAAGIAEEIGNTELNYNRTYLLDSANINPMTEELKSWEPETYKGQVPDMFYTYFGFRDWYRFPLVYPYSINCADDTKWGILNTEEGILDIALSSNDRKGTGQYQINRIACDQNYLLMFQQELYEDPAGFKYRIFDFKNQKTVSCKTYDKLFKKAKEMGYTGPDSLMSLAEYGRLFSKSEPVVASVVKENPTFNGAYAKFSDATVRFEKLIMAYNKKDYKQGKDGVVSIEMDLGPTVTPRIQIEQESYSKIEVFERGEVVYSINDEGPHCDFIQSQGVFTPWQPMKEVKIGFQYESNIIVDNGPGKVEFTKLTLDQFNEKAIESCGDSERWMETLKAIKSMNDYRVSYGVNKLHIEVRCYKDANSTPEIKKVILIYPLGC